MNTQLQGLPLNQFALMSRYTGARIYDTEHLRQSIVNILTTPIGSRVMRRDYGSHLYLLIDRNINRLLPVKVINAVATALDRWEPRLKITHVQIVALNYSQGQIQINLTGVYKLDGEPFSMKDISLDFFAANQYTLDRPDVYE